MKCAVLYASDYRTISPGGIQRFVWLLGQHLPKNMSATYFGVGLLKPPRPSDYSRAVLSEPPKTGPLNLAFCFALFSFRRELSNFDVVVCHRPEYVALVPRGPRTILVLHGGTLNAWRNARKIFGFAHLIVENLAVLRADKVLTVDKQGFFPRRKFQVTKLVQIRVPAAEEFYVNQLSPPSAEVGCLVTTARLVHEKRIHRLIDLAHRSGRTLSVIGSGPCRTSLERYAQKLNAKVTFHGECTPNEISDIYSRSSAFVSASLFEGYPLAAVEAAVFGLPLLSIESSGLLQLEPYGIYSNLSFEQAVAKLSSQIVVSPEFLADEVRNDHQPSEVAREFWNKVVA